LIGSLHGHEDTSTSIVRPNRVYRPNVKETSTLSSASVPSPPANLFSDSWV
jgi:hypothetical protein